MKHVPLHLVFWVLVVFLPEAAAQPRTNALARPPVAQMPELRWREAEWLGYHVIHAMAYDPERERVVMFGGWSGNSAGNTTWDWDGKDWRKRFPRTRPPGRGGHFMAYDPVRNTVLMFGGRDIGGAFLNDTWEWDGNDWRRLWPKNSPSPRFDFRMATDFTRNQIVLFGGTASSSTWSAVPMGDTWIWNGSDWTQVNPKTQLMARMGHEMCFNPLTGRVVLFGGFWFWPAMADNNTYEWDGKDWVQLATNGTRPVQMVLHDMVFDPTLNRVILHSGRYPQFGGNNWTWDGSQWKLLQPQTNPPEHTNGGWRSATDFARKQVVLFGYADPYKDQNRAQTWTFDGKDWKLLHKWGQAYPAPAHMPARAVHDSARDEFVIVGAEDPGSQLNFIFTTWVVRNDRYVKMTPKTLPPFRFPSAVCYHAGMKKTVMLGGELGEGKYLTDVWTWNGTDWQEHPTSNKQPWPGRLAARVVYDSRRQKVVYLHGTNTWEWDANGWVQRTPKNNPPVGGPMAYDSRRGRTVLWVYRYSKTPQHELWEWDGQDWQQIQPKVMPPPLSGAVLGYSHDLGGVVLFAGAVFPLSGGYSYNKDAWLWDGKAWRELKIPETWRVSVPYAPGKAVYDANRQRLRGFILAPYYYDQTLSTHNLFAQRPYPRPGQSAVLDVVYPGKSQPFWLALSTENWPGVPLRHIPYVGDQVLPLKAGLLLDLSIQARLIIQLDQFGRGSISLPIPKQSSLVGLRLHAAGILVGNASSIDAISNDVEIEIIR